MNQVDVESQNPALVTKTLVFNAARAIDRPDELTWAVCLDLSSLCEASVILDSLEAIDSSDVLPAFTLTSALRKAELLREFQPVIAKPQLERVLAMLPGEFQDVLFPPSDASSLMRDETSSRTMGEEGTLMKRRRHTPEQVIRKLREAERMLGEGKTIPEAAKELGISEQTYHRWRNQYGGMKANDAKRLKELERENSTLKAIVADQALENRALKEIARGNW